MEISLLSLSDLQRDLLHALAANGGLKRARGGYITHAGAKPFTVRTVLALQRMGLVSLGTDTSRVALTGLGSTLLVAGRAHLPEVLAG